jgi:hypothetical protein
LNRRSSNIVQYLNSESANDAENAGKVGQGSEGTAKDEEGARKEGAEQAMPKRE